MHQQLSWRMDDGFMLYGQEWSTEDAPSGVILLVHGLGEHSGRYSYVGETFANGGFSLLCFDLRGHGKSGGKRGVGSFDRYIRDIDCLLQQAAQKYPATPKFLYGHSLGGAVVIEYLLQKHPVPPQLFGAIASAPGLAPGYPVPPSKVFLGRLLSKIAPEITMKNGLPPEGLSHDASIVQAYRTDPLVHDWISTRLGIDLLDAGPWAVEHAHELTLPLLISYGSEDPVVSIGKIKEFVAQAGPKCTCKVWDGLYHEIHNEIQKDQVIRYYINWCSNQLGLP